MPDLLRLAAQKRVRLGQETTVAHDDAGKCQDLRGHNAAGVTIAIEARFFNSLARYSGGDGLVRKLEVPADETIGSLIARLRLPLDEIFLVLRNGRDISPGLYQGGNVNTEASISAGDVIAFSGPVPYSYGYGAPVV